MKRLIIMMGAAVIIAPLMLSADDYQFIISGDPVAAATVNSSESATPGTALVTSSRTTPTVAVSLEARYRTIEETGGIALRTDKYTGFTVILK